MYLILGVCILVTSCAKTISYSSEAKDADTKIIIEDSPNPYFDLNIEGHIIPDDIQINRLKTKKEIKFDFKRVWSLSLVGDTLVIVGDKINAETKKLECYLSLYKYETSLEHLDLIRSISLKDKSRLEQITLGQIKNRLFKSDYSVSELRFYNLDTEGNLIYKSTKELDDNLNGGSRLHSYTDSSFVILKFADSKKPYSIVDFDLNTIQDVGQLPDFIHDLKIQERDRYKKGDIYVFEEVNKIIRPYSNCNLIEVYTEGRLDDQPLYIEIPTKIENYTFDKGYSSNRFLNLGRHKRRYQSFYNTFMVDATKDGFLIKIEAHILDISNPDQSQLLAYLSWNGKKLRLFEPQAGYRLSKHLIDPKNQQLLTIERNKDKELFLKAYDISVIE